MQRALTLYQSTIGKKVAMALSGLVIVGFTVGHMLGNLNAYVGEDAFNEYAATLHEAWYILWPTRFVLLAAVSVHIVSAFSLVTRNKDARPQAYHMTKHTEATFASKAMPVSGIALLLFIGFHLLHFTLAPQLFNDPLREPVLELLRGPLAPAAGGHLHRRQPGPRPAHLPRVLQRLPDHRRQPPQVQPAAP
jgi:succinate dehydrogenase/fumarate reductase cytochrome b subunit